ncbi:MAG: trehalose-6-phosphate synthase [Actinomycetota bacterium]|nr:trehalose-6-phosphate synthase [Actinomycetota bacterium]
MIVVSHRGPVSFSAEEDGTYRSSRGAGGVVSGLAPLLSGTGATCVAAAISDDDRAAVKAGAATVPGFDLVLLDLDPRLHGLHYDVVSNGTLWPLFHGMFDLVRRPRFDGRFREAWDAYVAVNEAFAAAAAKAAGEGDVVLTQDYQLALVPGALRKARPDLALVHFTHTPFCGPEGIRVLPEAVASELCGSMGSVPAGFHTRRWVRNYAASAAEVLGPVARLTSPFAAALGPDPADLAEAAASPEAQAAAARFGEVVGDRAVVVRVDRLEPSKNIVRGFAVFDLLLESRPEWRERVVFVALAYPSRENLPEYLAYRQEVEQAARRVNQRWGTDDWQPVVLDTNDDYPTSVAALGGYDVLMVNPVRDGLNLVAKEGALLNRRDGVLCLSRGAGSFDELADAAIEIHAFDVLQGASALHAALSMSGAERATRARRLRELAGARTPAMWLDDLLAHAG